MVTAEEAVPSPHDAYAQLPDPANCWALVTGASSGLGRELASACVQAGYGVLLTEPFGASDLEALAEELRSQGPQGTRVKHFYSDLADPNGPERLYREVRLRGCDVALLLLASDQFSYTGSFLLQPTDSLHRLLALNVGATTSLCHLIGRDMAAAGRGRILLVGAPTGASPGVKNACAFAGSMAFVRALADGLRQELSPLGVGVSCLWSTSVGRETSLAEALSSTCVAFLVARDSAVEAASAPSGSPQQPKDSDPELSYAYDPDQVLSDAAWKKAYEQLAQERHFEPLPYGAEIDRLQRSSPAELSNALLVGFVCLIFTVNTLPDLTQQTRMVLDYITGVANMLFFLDYLARWWSRGLRWDYLLTPAMIFDLISVLPFLLRPWFPIFQGVELIFLKLLRVLRVYRWFRPKAFKDIAYTMLPPEEAEQVERFINEVKPYQLQVVRAFGIITTLVFVTAGLIYQFEHCCNPLIPDFFAAVYFSCTCLSTVGFGDITPVTPGGRLVTMVSIAIGLCIVPFQASAVAAAVVEEQREEREATGSINDAEAVLEQLERSRTQLAWDAARIAELERRAAESELRRKEAALGGSQPADDTNNLPPSWLGLDIFGRERAEI